MHFGQYSLNRYLNANYPFPYILEMQMLQYLSHYQE